MNTETSRIWPSCPDRLSNEQIASFRDQGFLAFNNVFAPSEVDESRKRISELIGGLVSAAKAAPDGMTGKERFLHAPDGRFAVQFENGTDFFALSGMELELKVRKLMWYCEADDFFEHQSAHHPRIQSILADLIGPRPIMFQDMALIKPPKIGSVKPWHQDNAYFSVVPLDAIVGVWIALDQATIENGCMHVIPGGHKGGARLHYHDRDCEIVPDRIDASAAVPVELEPGGALFFYGMLPHQTPPNRSPNRRRALQWHYHAATAHSVSAEEFDKVFAEADGTPASCRAAGQRDKQGDRK